MSQWHNIPLQGRSLIEASAGTGKTWTISALYLRLLIQTEFRPRQILVATFSDAAAEELRERIRSTLDAAIEQIRRGEFFADSPLRDLLGGLDVADYPPQLLLRLQLAAQELDLAPIGTLHSVCKRILSEHALDTGSPLNWDQLIDERALHEAVCLDLWRELIHGQVCSVKQRRQLLSDGLDKFKSALRALAQRDSNPKAPLPGRVEDCARLEQAEYAPALRALAAAEGVFKLANSAVRGELCKLADLLESDESAAPNNPASEFKNLLAGDIDAEPLSKQIRPEARDRLANDANFDFALRAAAVLAHAARSLRGSALAELLPRYRQRRQIALQRSEGFTYQLLIDRVEQALGRPEQGRELADQLFARWPIAMVDEFQDTDAKQYAILDRLYRSAAGEVRGSLMMIGDPKQAIYGFRGGDLLTYQRAASETQQRMHLDTNFRASAPYVQAINALYAAADDGFGMLSLAFHPVKPSTRREGKPYCQTATLVDRPLKLHVLGGEALPTTVAERQRWALSAAAEQIVALLDDDEHRVADQRLHAGQFAVLLPTNDQVAAMREELRRRGVPCAGAGRSDVFATAWAEALQLLLWAWLHPGDSGALRACLMSPLFGFDYAALCQLEQTPDQLSDHAERFADAARRWQRNGVLAALIPSIEQQAARLLAEPERGERALTDLRHLGELLAEAELQGCHGEALWRWLADQRARVEEEPGEDRQLRVESDRQRVTLLTLHASKGLEFDFVLLPLMFAHGGRNIDLPSAPDPNSGQLRIDLGSEDYSESCAWAAAENQRERLRLLYVALTRAVYRCDVWLIDPAAPARTRTRPTDPERSALDRLLAPLLAQQPRPTLAGVEWLPASAEPGCTRLASKGDAARPAAQAREPLPTLRPLQRQLSFSSLAHAGPNETRHAEDETDSAAATSPPLEQEPEHPLLQAMAGLRGTQFGNALHGMLENRELGLPFAAQGGLIRDQLRAFGLPTAAATPAWVSRIGERLDQALNTPLLPDLTLADLDADTQQAELDFRIALGGLSLRRLREVCERYADARLLPKHWRDEQLQGLLVGKIDLVFAHRGALHVLDYKSNFLGLRLSDYQGDALNQAMDHSAYRFQALLYCVAVHRYLAQRQRNYEPDRHLGEACYLFLRAFGLSADLPELGLWRHRFDPRLIAAVDTVLADEELTVDAA